MLSDPFGCANHDDRKFRDGDRLDIFSHTEGHMGFGFGVHSRLGASLARFESITVLISRRVAGPELSGC